MNITVTILGIKYSVSTTLWQRLSNLICRQYSPLVYMSLQIDVRDGEIEQTYYTGLYVPSDYADALEREIKTARRRFENHRIRRGLKK